MVHSFKTRNTNDLTTSAFGRGFGSKPRAPGLTRLDNSHVKYITSRFARGNIGKIDQTSANNRSHCLPV